MLEIPNEVMLIASIYLVVRMQQALYKVLTVNYAYLFITTLPRSWHHQHLQNKEEEIKV